MYVFETIDNKNYVYLYVSDNINSNLLRPNNMYGYYHKFCAVELKSGEFVLVQ